MIATFRRMKIDDVSFPIEGGGYFRAAHQYGKIAMSVGNGPSAQLVHLTPEEALQAARTMIEMAGRIVGRETGDLPTVEDLRAHAHAVAEREAAEAKAAHDGMGVPPAAAKHDAELSKHYDAPGAGERVPPVLEAHAGAGGAGGSAKAIVGDTEIMTGAGGGGGTGPAK